MRVLACGFLVADIVVAGLDRIAGPGEVLRVPRGIVLSVGGHPANVSVDLAKLGLPPSEIGVCGAVGQDFLGDFIVRTLEGYGLRLFIERVPASTNKNVILVVKGEDRRFHVELGASDLLRPEAIIDIVERERPEVFYLASGITDLVDRVVGHVFRRAKEAGSLTFADFVPPHGKGWDYLVPALPFIDVLHCNEAEALGLTGAGSVEEAVRWLLERGVKLVLVTRGGEGALAATERLVVEQPAFRVEVVDPTGAGDAFCAGTILALLERGLRAGDLPGLGSGELAQLLLWGQAAGAAACTAPGTTEGVSRSKVEELIGEQGRYLLSRTSVRGWGAR